MLNVWPEKNREGAPEEYGLIGLVSNRKDRLLWMCFEMRKKEARLIARPPVR